MSKFVTDLRVRLFKKFDILFLKEVLLGWSLCLMRSTEFHWRLLNGRIFRYMPVFNNLAKIFIECFCNFFMIRWSDSIMNQVVSFFLIHFIIEKSFYCLLKFPIIINIVEFFICKIFPFSFLQKINTIVSCRKVKHE